MKKLSTLELVETLSKLQIEKDYSIVAEPLIKMVDSEKVNILDRFISEINAERDSLIKKFKDFYFKKSNYQEFDEKGLSPAEIFEIIQKYSVRLERLFMIYKPDFSQTITKNSKNEEYDMVKINWIDEENKKIKISNYQINPVGEYSYKNIDLKEVGPSFDLIPRRNQLCSDDEYKVASKQPKLTAEENTKNIINNIYKRNNIF